MDKKLHLVSLGCNKNLVDSEVMLGRLRDYELTDAPEDADVLIVNTCGFIGAAKEESLNTIFSLHDVRKKDSLLVVSGCLTQRYQEELIKELPEVDIFTGVGDYDHIDMLIENRKSQFSNSTYLIDKEDRVITGVSTHAYIKLSEGCNQQCSFCAIPGFKGKLKSRELTSVIREVNALREKGVKDFTFISQDSSSYLRDKGISDGLCKLIDEVEKLDGVVSARILYLYPTTTSHKLIEKIINSKVFHNYFDMPIQHISDSMLKKMRRGAGEAKLKELLSLMREAPDSFVRTSFIVGHPDESDEEFSYMLKFLDEFKFDRVNVFAYSDEEDTPAFDMINKISTKVINERLKKMEKKISKNTIELLKENVGKDVTLFIEGENSEHELFLGARKLIWAPEIDGEVLINENEEKDLSVGEIVQATITELVGDKLIATVKRRV